jgi:prevent-host-death family protein
LEFGFSEGYMDKIVPITDLQRQVGQIITDVKNSDALVIITQRGRAAAVLISAERYSQIEKDQARLDELELEAMLAESRQALSEGRTLAHSEVKRRLQKRDKGVKSGRGRK